MHISLVRNRLELRTKSLRKKGKAIDDIAMLIENWGLMLDKSIAYYDKLQDLCNEHLLVMCNKEYGGKIKSKSELLRKHADNIYMSKQMKKFYKLLGFNNYDNMAKNFLRNNRACMEFFSMNDLKKYVFVIKNSNEKFINGEQNDVLNAPFSKNELVD